jgi:D-serine deaminase-like pyridoxal phosphate-dependent protein
VNEVGLPKSALDTPFLWVDLDALERNISQMAAFFRDAGVNWRPHIKGNKTPAIARMLLDAGAIGLTCAKLGEAEVMAAEGARDILIVNQIVGQKKYERLADLCRFADVKIAVDGTATLADLNAAAVDRDVEIGVIIELNTGMNRAGVEPGQPVVQLAGAIQAYPGMRLRGLMTWEGHALGIEDEAVKRQTIATAIDQLTTSADLCRQAGFPIEIVSCGGSGTYVITASEPGVTEIQAGGAIFKDMTYASWNVPTEHALFVHSVVTSHPVPNRIIIDAGFKALPRSSHMPQPIGFDGVEDMFMSAEHGIITLDHDNEEIEVGDRFDFIPAYGDTTVFLHDNLYALRDGVVEAVWPIAARGKLR